MKRGIGGAAITGVLALCLLQPSEGADPPGATDPASKAAAPASGASDAEWLARVERDLAEREYHISWTDSPGVKGLQAAWQAPNRAHGFRTHFTAEGIRLLPRAESDASWRWGLSLAGYGRGGTIWNVAASESLVPLKNRIEYQRNAVQEIYENRPEGLEQSFVLTTPPGMQGKNFEPVEIRGWTKDLRRPAALRDPGSPAPETGSRGISSDSRHWFHLDLLLWGDLSPRISEDGQAIDFMTPSGKPALHYAQLKVTDGRGEVLPAWMEGFTGPEVRGIRIVVDARNAIYPILVDPLITGPAWMAESDQASAQIGLSVAPAGDVNGDGYADVIAGAQFYDNGQSNEGRAFVYLGSAAGPGLSPAWTAESDQASSNYSSSVAPAGDVNGDGYADVIVGAAAFDNGQSNEGRAFVYLGSAAGLGLSPAWTAESDQASSLFGYSVATAGDVNGDGYADVIVGARNYSDGQATEGGAFVYLGSATGLGLTPAWAAGSDQPGANFGNSVATGGDVNGDGYADVIVGAWFYDNGEGNEGRAFVYLGSVTGPGASPAWTAESDQTSAQFGRSVATAGDVNGDGYADVIVGADLYDNGESEEGRAFVYLGSTTGLGSSPAWTAESDQASANFGNSVATAGDVNGDGYADVIVGAWLFDNGESDEGRAYVYLGSAAGLGSSAAWTAESDQLSANFGISVATAGDVNGDGYSDIIAGAQLYDNGQLNEGRVFVYLGSADGPETTPSRSYASSQVNEGFGWSTDSAGDVNGDGFSDVIVGASGYDNGHADEGRALLYLGSASGVASTPAWTYEGDEDGISFGLSVASAGDVNGDGYGDVIIGASGWGPYSEVAAVANNRVHVFHGTASGLAPTPSWTVVGDQAFARLGNSVASAGDVNGDGYADVIVGAYLYDAGQSNEGRAYIYLGSPSGLAATPAWTAEGNLAAAGFGWAVASAGDVNRDGYSDVLVGAQFYDDGTTTRGGRAYLFLGSASGVSTLPSWTDGSFNVGDTYGYAVGTAGDVNGDGYSDIIVGNPFNGFTNGRATLYLGSSSGVPAFSWTFGGSQFSYFGVAVGTAGDVNHDGYGDVLVSSIAFSPTLRIFYGSSAGLAATPGWTASMSSTSDPCELGDSMALAGDVNGDGYSDIVAGDSCGGAAFGGSAHVFYGSEGGGVQRFIRQAWPDGSERPIARLGRSISETSFLLDQRGSTAAGRGKVRMQWQVESIVDPPLGSALQETPLLDTGPPIADGSYTDIYLPVFGLAEGHFYRWRARIASSNPFFPRSPWMTLEGRTMTEAKLRTGGCIDVDGDGYGALGDASCLSLTPDCSDSIASAWDTPGVVSNPTFTTTTTLTWGPPVAPGALLSSLVYDTLASTNANDFLSLSTLCIESNDGSDTMATVSAMPPVGQVYYYLSRAENACPIGVGPLGFTSAGVPRQGRSCP